ncbi:MAG: MBL fold metallo-hydrolase [Chitinispirillales bacterium]|jgi:competence protein ComEC|nr:MBL fold metallo-hydrolase [Chitinispirillales bacterium]
MFISEDRPVTISKDAFLLTLLCLIAVTVLVNCTNPISSNGGNASFTFTVADVGQGLAQFGVMDGRAVLWDMGPPSQYPAWRGAYNSLGRPRIEMIVISHFDNDHYGGLQHLDENTEWSGAIAVSPVEDTAGIRSVAAAEWRNRINFHVYAAGDTLKVFGNVEIICLWPPRDTDPELPLNSRDKNRYSMVFSVRHGHSRALVTSDIDYEAMNAITLHSAHNLRAQILSAPHHGSAGSVHPLFFAYVSADAAIISCSRQNTHGHPSRQMVDELTYQGTRLFYTYLDHSVTFTSNGHYWQYSSANNYSQN